MSFETVTEPVTRTQIVRFAGAAGDFNPIHHDDVYARETGQPGVFAMGQLTAALMAAAVAEWLGRDNVATFGVQFKDRVWPGDRLVLRGEFEDGRCELQALRESDATVVLTGWATTRSD